MATIHRLKRTLIRVSGPDARGFLDNLLTQNLGRLDETGVTYGALLSPQGKLIADMLIWADGDGVILDVDPGRGADLLRRLTMYKLRAQVAIEQASDRALAWSGEAFEGAKNDPRLPALGARKLIGVQDAAALPEGAEAYDSQRLELGVPDLARDAAPEEVFALEALLEELNGVDFHKGCFVGQENVSRMKRRATTRKKFCSIAFEGAAPAYGAAIAAGAAEIGTVRTGHDGRAIALLRLDRAFEANSAGLTLKIAERETRLDPPPWLILPSQAGDAD